LKAAAFAVPALALWQFSSMFLFPKLEEIWKDAGFSAPSAHTAMGFSDLFTQHGILISAALVLVLILLEWRSLWLRYRRVSIGVAVFLLNSAVLVLITSMLMFALMAAPALLPKH